MTDAPKISVCIPVYNAALHLKECIDSVLCQTFTDFELLLVDDGSADESISIIESYADPRIRLIKNAHDFIGTLNLLLTESNGKYIARMDADDIMVPERLQWQYEYMEQHPEIGVLGGGLEMFGKSSYTYQPIENITLSVMLNGCYIPHPASFIRRDIIVNGNFRYEQDFIYAEDYRLWLRMLCAGVKFRNLQKVVLRYRTSDTQVSCVKSEQQQTHTEKARNEAAQWLLRQEKMAKEEAVIIPASTNELTLVIPFLNEGEEVANTVRSARQTVGDAVDVIVINDCSDDGYDYEADLAGLNVHYVRNAIRIGAAASKEKGAQLSVTPYFILLDAHMRFYGNTWVSDIVQTLKQNDNQLLCCQTKVLLKKDGVVTDGDTTPTAGAYLRFDHEEYIPGIRWSTYKRAPMLEEYQIPAVLGAGYAASKRYWNKIKGLQGLIHYGSEEPYISIKAWLEGGGCRLLPQVVIGHIYRDKFPYQVCSDRIMANSLFIVATLFPTSERCLALAVAQKKDEHLYASLTRWLKWYQPELRALRDYYRATFKNDFSLIRSINSLPNREELNLLQDEQERIETVMTAVDEYASGLHDYSLYSGIAGIIALYCQYALYTGNQDYDAKASQLFEKLLENINGELPVSLHKGVCGVGWSLLYLLGIGAIEDDIEAELTQIDKLVMERNPLRVQDFSLKSGLGGILAYVVARLGYARRVGLAVCPFDDEYLDDLKKAAQTMLNTRQCDYRCVSFAMQLMEYGQADWCILPPQWDEIVDLPTFLPKDKRYWQHNLNGSIGYGVLMTQGLDNLKNITIN